jgi:hypothetical protein
VDSAAGGHERLKVVNLGGTRRTHLEVPFNLLQSDGVQCAIDIGLYLQFGQVIDLIFQLACQRGLSSPQVSFGLKPTTAIRTSGDMVCKHHEVGGRQPAGVEVLDLEISRVCRSQINVPHKSERSHWRRY